MPTTGPDREFHDECGNSYLLLGQRIMKNWRVLASPTGCTTVMGCELAGDRLKILFLHGSCEISGIREGPPSPAVQGR